MYTELRAVENLRQYIEFLTKIAIDDENKKQNSSICSIPNFFVSVWFSSHFIKKFEQNYTYIHGVFIKKEPVIKNLVPISGRKITSQRIGAHATRPLDCIVKTIDWRKKKIMLPVQAFLIDSFISASFDNRKSARSRQ